MGSAQTQKTTKTYKDYMDLIETVAKVEYKRLSASYFVDFSEFINIGIITIHTILKNNPTQEYNITYLSTAIKWAIRNELRKRYKWYTLRSKSEEDEFGVSQSEQVREAIYETILSIDELAEADNPTQIKDYSDTPDEESELSEITQAIREAIKKLAPRQREIIEARFYKNRKLKELADDFEISPSRVSRIIQSALNKIKIELKRQKIV